MNDSDPAMWGPTHSTGPVPAWQRCRFCGEFALIKDPNEDFGSSPCDACDKIEDSRPDVWKGPVRYWIEKRRGRWFLWLSHKCEGSDMMVREIEAPGPDENI